MSIRSQTSTVLATLGLIALTLALALVGAVGGASAQASEACSNEARRVEQRATSLPDCRAYEVVSPPQSEPHTEGEQTIPVSLTGERVGFFSEFGPPPSFTGRGPGFYFVSSRGPAGWSTQGEIPRQSTVTGLLCIPYVAGYSADLSKAVLADGWNWSGYPRRPDNNGTRNCGHDEPLLVPGEPQGAQNIFLHASEAANEAGLYQLLNLTPPAPSARDAYFRAGSADFSHIVFTSPLQLTPEAPLPPEQTAAYSVGEDLYENVGGVLHLVTFLPGGAPTWGILANSWESNEADTSAGFTHAVSDDGERVFFYASGEQYCGNGLKGAAGTTCTGEGAYLNAKLYLRQNAAQAPAASGECSPAETGKACTVQVDEKNIGAPGPGGGGQFQSATPDGSRAFFTDCSRLTADSTAVSSGGCGGFALTQNGYQPPTGQDLYEYDVAKPLGQRLTDLTVDSTGTDSLGADVQGVAGISADGSYVYFVARGVLTGGEENEHHEKAAAGETNLYLRHAGATTFIATLGPPISNETARAGPKGQLESCDWASAKTPERTTDSGPGVPSAPCLTSRVSPDGRFLAFNSRKRLTGYDNTVAASGVPSFEIFRYDAATSKLSCASCDPEGTPPTAAETGDQPSISVPLPTGEGFLKTPAVTTGQLSDGGRLFFSTANSLLPADVNGSKFDVYEYDGGGLHLISSGTGNYDSEFHNASLDGANVFFTTADALVSSDTDESVSLYDARVGGGFLAAPAVGPGGVVEAPACTSVEACKPPPGEPPVEPFPASSAFRGAGNVVSPPGPVLTGPKKTIKCPRGKRLSHGKCVKEKPKKHKPKKSSGRKPKKSSGRQGSK